MGLIKAVVNRTNGKGNAEMDEKVTNFYQFVAIYSTTASMIVSENLQSAMKWWIRKLNSQDIISFILEDEHNIVFSRMKNAILYKAIYDKAPVKVSLAINAKKVAKLCDVSYTYEEIIGGDHPNYKVDVYGLYNDDINATLNGSSKSMKLEEANEVKVSVM